MLDNQLHGAPSELVKILHYSFKRRLEIEAVRRAVITGDSLEITLRQQSDDGPHNERLKGQTCQTTGTTLRQTSRITHQHHVFPILVCRQYFRPRAT